MNQPAPALHVFEILAKQHEAMLLAYVRSLMPDAVLAEDVAQQTWIIAFRKIDSLSDPAAFPAWLRGIARLEAFAMIRRQGREIPVAPEVLHGLEEAYRSFEEDHPTRTWEERFRLVEECYEQLPETLRAVCRLHYFENRKARNIADLLTVNLSAVLKRLERARAALRDCVARRVAASGGEA